MKRLDFIKYLTINGCYLLREGGNHSIYENKKNKKISAIPRHKELDRFTCKSICKQLEIPIFENK